MTNKYNHQGHNSLIAAIISWILLFCSCEIAWAKNECKKPVEKVVSCNEQSYAAHQGESKDNIEYKGWNGLKLISEGLTLATKPDKDNVSGIKIATSKGRARNEGFDGDMTLIWKSGKITTGDSGNIGKTSSVKAGSDSDGLRIENTGKGATSLKFNDGTIHTYGYNSKGIHGWQRLWNKKEETNGGDVTVTFSGAESSITTYGKYGDGILGRNNIGIGNTSVIASDGTIETNGISSPSVRGQNDGKGQNPEGDVEVKTDKLIVTTKGDDSAGVVARTGADKLHNLSASPSGNATVNLKDSSITTLGNRTSSSLIKGGAHGILALTTGSGIASITQDGGDISTSGDNSHGIFSLALYSDKDNAAYVKQETDSTVKTSGVDSYGLSVVATGGSAKVEQLAGAKISNTGKGADGISAIGKNGVDITVAGKITGGRFGGQSVIANKGHHGVGIHVATGKFTALSPLEFTSNTKTIAINIGETGIVEALSDKAIVVDGGAAEITNKGTITGTVSTWNQCDTFTNTNNAKWEIRNFQLSSDAINPDTIKRDTENVAVADFGEGDDRFINNKNATVQLETVGSQSDGFPINYSTSTISEYRPDYNSRTSEPISSAGVEQAHIVNLERFENAGTITMADKYTGGTGPVAGDVLVITSSKSANEPAGTSQFVSNGGELHIDTQLDDGKYDLTDVLVVDSVELETKATTLVVNNVDPDKGASTDINCNGEPDNDEGILVIDVRGNRSDNDAFVLKDKLMAGDWEYKLHQTDGKSWFLHSLEAKPITNINFHGDSIYQSDGKNIKIGHLNAEVTDNCQHKSITFQLVSGQGDSDNSKVSLKGDTITLSDTFSDDQKKDLSIRVQAELNNYKFSKALTIAVDNPIVISEQSDSKPKEPVTDEPVVEEPVTEEHEAEKPVANAISDIVEGGNAQNTDSKDINTAVSHNKETNTFEHSVPDEADQSTIQTISDNRVSSPSAVVTSITDIDLSSNIIDEDKARGTIIGRLSAVITGDNRNVSYRLVSGAGDTDNNKISISGNQLISTDVFDFERNSTLSIRVQAEIQNRPLFEKALTIAIKDTEADGCINHQIVSKNRFSPLPFISSAYASNGTAVVSNTSIFVWLLHCFALRFIYQSKKINGRWKRLFILGLTISLVACGGGGGQSAWQC